MTSLVGNVNVRYSGCPTTRPSDSSSVLTTRRFRQFEFETTCRMTERQACRPPLLTCLHEFTVNSNPYPNPKTLKKPNPKTPPPFRRCARPVLRPPVMAISSVDANGPKTSCLTVDKTVRWVVRTVELSQPSSCPNGQVFRRTSCLNTPIQ